MMGNTDDTTEPVTIASMHATVTDADAPNRKPSTAVVEAVAEMAGVEPMELGTALYDVVDPDALDELFAPTLAGAGRGNGRVTFTLAGYQVTVSSDGLIEVRGDGTV